MMNFERYRARSLQSDMNIKPLDFGLPGLVGSINRDGRIVSLNTFHAEYGYATITSLPPFDETQRYNSTAVRAYRRSLADAKGFGINTSDLKIISREYSLLEDVVPLLRFTLEDNSVLEIVAFVSEYNGMLYMVYACQSSGDLGRIRFDGSVSIQRCAYTQLTEGGPLPMPPVKTQIVNASQDGTTLCNEAMNMSVATNLVGAKDDGQGVRFDAEIDLNGQACFIFRPGTGAEISHTDLCPLTAVESMLSDIVDRWRLRWQDWEFTGHPLDLPLRRALIYATYCCVSTDELALSVITDHQLLPLSWTRDAYYTIMPLLEWGGEFPDWIKRHLVWLFERAQRDEGYWGRAYLTNGQVKDPAMQLDQQLYPLLELAEYCVFTGDMALWQSLEYQVDAVLNMLAGVRDHATGLFPTHETPADDPVHLPFHLSSHILFWHTLNKLSQVGKAGCLELADEIKRAVNAYFVTTWRGLPIYAYLTDGKGNFHLYHDANDLPLALAPDWGFCLASDATWANTMQFGFSHDNTGGYYGTADDLYPGLGSIHTPDAWHLGCIQEYLYANAIRDEARKQHVIQKITQTMQWDGGLSEAFTAESGQIISRPWFAWPGSALHFCKWSES